MVERSFTKKRKFEGNSVEQTKFTSGREIHFALRDSRNVSEDAIRSLRNQLTVRSKDAQLSSDDGRVILVREWLEICPGADDLFEYLDTNTPPSSTAICLSIISNTLELTSAHLDNHAAGLQVLRKLLTPRWIHRLQALFSGSHTDTTLATLKLVNNISSFASGRERKALLEAFTWELKVFHKLLVMRRKGKTHTEDLLQKPDIRTLCLKLILSFIRRDSSTQTKAAFLEQRRDLFLSIFKGLSGDPYSVVRYVLEEIWVNIWQDPKIKRSIKVGLFGEVTIQHLLKLYERSTSDGTDSESIPADVVHHFMLGIATHRGVGICFADNGWYPRSNDEEDHRRAEDERERHLQKGGRIYNKILSNVLKMLRVNEDARQQELALKILAACPELVSGYLPSAGITLEPRLSSRWLVNIAFLGSAISQTVPFESFYLPVMQNVASSSTKDRQFRPNPPPLSTLVENILPSMSLKTHFSKGLQSSSALVQHATAVALAKCLQKCEAVLTALHKVHVALEEDEFSGQWSKRHQEVQSEVRKRLPDFQVIIAFSQQKAPVDVNGDGASSAKQGLLAEVSQRLLWLYHHCVPSMVAEVNFEAGKSLQGLWQRSNESGLSVVQQLLVLRMLGESAQFSWSARPGGHGAPSNIAILLSLYSRTEEYALKGAVQSLLEQTFASGPLFQHDPTELRLWLGSLPSSARAADAKAPDGAPLTSESESVVSFLEDCFHRCSKSAYRYLEDMTSFVSGLVEEGGRADGRNTISPLIMTVMEQLAVKAKNGTLSPSDLLALATYVRKLIVKLMGTQEDLVLVKGISKEISKVLHEPNLCDSHPILTAAIQREASILHTCVSQLQNVGDGDDLLVTNLEDIEAQQRFLSEIESMSISEQESQRKITAYELVDWLRFGDKKLQADELKRLVKAVHIRFPAALADVFYQVPPKSEALWDLLSEKAHADLFSWVDFDWLLVHACDYALDERRKATLGHCLEEGTHTINDYKRYVGYAFLAMASVVESPRCSAWLDVVAILLTSAKAVLNDEHFRDMKVFFAQENDNLKSFLCNGSLSPVSSSALETVIDFLFKPSSDFDCGIVSPICSYWTDFLRSILLSGEAQNTPQAHVWLKFLPPDDVLSLTTCCAQVVTSNSTDSDFIPLLDRLLPVVGSLEPDQTSRWFPEHLSLLTRLRSLQFLPNLDLVLAKAITGGLPYGLSGFGYVRPNEGLPTIIRRAKACWASRSAVLDESIDLEPLFRIAGEALNGHVSSIFEGLIYRSNVARDLFWNWLKHNTDVWSSQYICRPLYAYLDTFDEDAPEGLSEDDEGILAEACSAVMSRAFKVVVHDQATSSISCGRLFLLRGRSKKNGFAKALQTTIDSLSVNSLHENVIRFGASLDKHLCTEFPSLSESIAKHGLNSVVRRLSSVSVLEVEDERLMQSICKFLKTSNHVPGDIAETTITTVIRHHFSAPTALKLADITFRSSTLKPVTVNRLLQSIVQHTHLQRNCGLGSSVATRDGILRLLSALFHAHPENTCQPSHIQPLIQLYGGTWSVSDRRIFAIFRLFESQGKGSVASLFVAWSPSMLPTPGQKFVDCIAGLEPARVFRTCLDFPPCRIDCVGDNQDEVIVEGEDSEVYDPLFIILIFCQGLLEGPPDSALSWVQLFRSNIVSLIIRSLSSPDDHLRYLALTQMRMLWKVIENSTMQEKQQVDYVLGLLRNLYQTNPEDDPSAAVPRLPSFTTLVLAHALRAIFYPSNFIYPLTSKFLLQRPEIDPTDVPMLYSMLFSSSDDWKRERAWMLRFLSDGMLSSEDWRVFKRRHTWDLLESLFQRSVDDKQLRRSVLDVLATLTCHKQSATSLVLKVSLIQWMEIQLLSFSSDEAVAWAKIIENISVVVDQEKLDQATRRTWRTGLLRCLNRLILGAELDLLMVIARATLRLSLSTEQDTRNLHAIVQCMLERLIYCESNLHVPLSGQTDEPRLASTAHGAPHRRGHLYEIGGHNSTSIDTWGTIIELLWSVTMTGDSVSEAWNALTCRLLLWRTMNPTSEAGEWARREVVRAVSHRRSRSAGP
ncbi:hypothetical protein SCHPADRAFT_652933 [Schizopora paradoxa]|uniref:Uncharacterized protein n=1 Tax=Schizopora paradoxa TaxID=27342 RepID=A0A0H2RCU8_9AGAM|nr:hypothetical protein SCHPADRAFT_652933 [Schizopora paradoxa]